MHITRINTELYLFIYNNVREFFDFKMCERQMVTQLSIRWNILLDSLVYTSQKLKELGFIYYNGEVTQIEEVGEAKKLSKRSYY